MNKILITCLLLAYAFSANAEDFPWSQATESHAGSKDITVYRSPNCGCCKGWVAHLKEHDFVVTDVEEMDVNSIKQQHGLPRELASCHTAIIDGYVIEGHVPADDIKTLLRDRPDVLGLSVPRMPTGTPGMEMGDKKDDFDVVSFDKEGNQKVYKHYSDY